MTKQVREFLGPGFCQSNLLVTLGGTLDISAVVPGPRMPESPTPPCTATGPVTLIRGTAAHMLPAVRSCGLTLLQADIQGQTQGTTAVTLSYMASHTCGVQGHGVVHPASSLPLAATASSPQVLTSSLGWGITIPSPTHIPDEVKALMSPDCPSLSLPLQWPSYSWMPWWPCTTLKSPQLTSAASGSSLGHHSQAA